MGADSATNVLGQCAQLRAELANPKEVCKSHTMPRRTWITSTSLGAILAACPDSPTVCDQGGCSPEPWIYIIDDGTASGSLRDGQYAFRIKSEHVEIEWTCTLISEGTPDSMCDGEMLTSAGKADSDTILWYVYASHGPSGLEIRLDEIRGPHGDSTKPAMLTIETIRDGVLQAVEMYKPEYDVVVVSEICGPKCWTAKDPVVLHIPE